jgi:hypothetical protein
MEKLQPLDYDLDKFSDRDLIDEIYARCLEDEFEPSDPFDSISDEDFEKEAKSRGILSTSNKIIYHLYSTYRTASSQEFDKELKQFFSTMMNKDIR